MNKSKIKLKVTALMANLFFLASAVLPMPFNKIVHADTMPVGIPITRVAGIIGKQSVGGYSGDNGLATNAKLSYTINGVAVDILGNMYIADNGNNRIRKVDALTGNITTIAGNGTFGDAGDGGPAIDAQMEGVSGIAVDSKGNVYFTEAMISNKVRKIDAGTGIITTIAGTTSSGFAGDGDLAVNAKLNDPEGITVDSRDNIYIADNFNNRVRKIDANTGIITTAAGSGSSGISGDNGPATSASFRNVLDVAVDKNFNIYIADSNGYEIRKVTAATGTISTIAGNGTQGGSGENGPATSATLSNPKSVQVDDAGNVYISDYGNNKIKKVDAVTQKITTIAGNGVNGYGGDDGLAINSILGKPTKLSIDRNGNIYICSVSSSIIRKIDMGTGIISRAAGSIGDAPYNGYNGDNGLAINSALYVPQGIAIDKQNNIYIADTYNNRIRKIDAVTGNISTIAGNGTSGYSGDGNLAINAKLNSPSGVAVDDSSNVYIADTYNNRIRKIDAVTGNISTIAGNGTPGYSGDGSAAISGELSYPNYVAVDSNGNNVYIADSNNSRIRKVDASGNISTVAGNGTRGYGGDGDLAINSKISNPIGISLDKEGNIYISDSGNNRVRKVDAVTGNISTVAGNGNYGFNGDGGLAINAAVSSSRAAVDDAGNIYIADSNNARIRKVDTAGIITTIAGNGTKQLSGDNSSALNATLNNPMGIALDSNGNVFIADSNNSQIRKLTMPRAASGLTVTTASETPAKQGKVTLSVLSSAVGSDNKIYYKVDSIIPSQLSVGDTIDPSNWIEVASYNQEISAANGSYVEAVEVAADNTVVSWGKTASETNDEYVAPVSSSLSTNTASFDKNLNNAQDISVDINLNGNTFTSIMNGPVTLVSGVDYTVTGITVTISKGYLEHLDTGLTTLTFNFSAGDTQGLNVTVTDTTPVAASGLTVIAAPEATPVQGKVNLTITPGAEDSNHKILYRVVDLAPIAENVGDEIEPGDGWVEVTDANAHEITVPNGKYIEAVEVTTGNYKVTKWGKSGAANDGYIASSGINPTSASFDKNTSNQADINVSMALNKYELGSILPDMLQISSYLPNTLEGNTVTIKKSDLANLASQSAELRFYDNKGNVKNLDASMSVGDAGVNLNMTLIENVISGQSLTDITNEGNTLVKGTDYIVNGSTVTIKRGFLTKVGTGTVNLVFSFGTKNLAVTMSTNETDVKATMTLYENSLVSITNGAYALVKGTDYTVDGNAVTIKKSYLSTLSTGTAALVFNFSDRSPQTLNVAISDTTPINYTAAFKNYDGSTIGTQTVVSGNKITAPAVPARTGYAFGGWYKEAECQNKWDFANNTVTSAVTLYAKWTVNSYTVTFKDYDGKTIGEPQTVNYGENATAPVAQKRTGYVFAGWDKNYSNVTGDLIVTATYTSGSTYDFPSSSTGGTNETRISTDYLKSRDNTLVINNTAAALAIPASAIDLVNGADHIKVTEKVVTPETNTVQGLFGNLPSSVAKMVGNPISLNAQLLDENDGFIKDIHQFSNNQKVKVTIKLTSAQIAGLDTTKLSMYYYDETSRTWVELGGSFNSTTMEFTFYTPHFTNFAIMNKVSTPAPSTGNTTPSVNSYTVTFKDYDGTVIGTPQAVSYGGSATAPTSPTRTGYTFTGWDKTFNSVTGNLVVTAQYSINNCTVTFKDYNGSVIGAPQTVNYGGSAAAPTAPTRTGYVFAGWDKTFDKVTGDLVVTAKYTSGNTYNFKPTTTSNGAETKISADYLTSRDNTLVINSDGAEISISAGAIDLTDGTNYIKVTEQSENGADVSKQYGSLPNGLRQIGSPLLLSIQLFDANNNYIKDIKKLSNNERVKVTMKFTADELKGVISSGLTMYHYDEEVKAWTKLEGSFDPSTMEMTFYMTAL